MTSSLALVGAGVRGTAALARLAARLRATTPRRNAAGDANRLIIHVIDPHPPGGGRIWRTDQARSLVMNTVAAQSTVFDDPSLDFADTLPGPTFFEWCEAVTRDELPGSAAVGTSEGEDAWVREAASVIRPWSTPPRALYGRYLCWAFAHIAHALPEWVELRVHRDRAVSLRRGNGEVAEPSYEIELASGGTLRAAGVLLALGWLPRTQHEHPAADVLPDSPIDQGVERILPGERIAVRGIGMGFIDLLGLVTEERGGRYEQGASGELRYVASGLEPRVYAGSRSGLPFLAKPEFGAVPPAARFDALQAALPVYRELPAGSLSFSRQVLPLIEHAAAAAHYRALAEHRPEAFATSPATLIAEFERIPETAEFAAADEAPASILAWRAAANAAVPDAAYRFDPERISLPLVPCRANATDDDAADAADGDTATADALDYDRATLDRIERDAADAALGAASPRKRGLHVYQAARVAIVPLTEFGRIAPHEREALSHYLTLANLAGSGPPLYRVRQLIALHRAGLVTFLGPSNDVRRTAERLLRNGERAEAPSGHTIDRVVDARLDLPHPLRHGDPLLESLLLAGLARTWPGDESGQVLEITPETSALVGADGTPAPGLHSVGPLHEELRRFTIIAPIPGARSTVLREIDAAVAALLREAGVPEAGVPS